MRPELTFRALAAHPSAFIPVLMSLVAIGVVAWSLLTGAVRQPDEGAAAHAWQLLMAGQVPIVAFFAVRWLPLSPRQGTIILALQLVAALAALAPVFLLRL